MVMELFYLATGRVFNSLMFTCYRGGDDHISWHADDEASLGPVEDVVVTSLSLGMGRLFQLRHNESGEGVEVMLGDGDLLVMREGTQAHWKHRIVKGAASIEERISITGRNIVQRTEAAAPLCHHYDFTTCSTPHALSHTMCCCRLLPQMPWACQHQPAPLASLRSPFDATAHSA